MNSARKALERQLNKKQTEGKKEEDVFYLYGPTPVINRDNNIDSALASIKDKIKKDDV